MPDNAPSKSKPPPPPLEITPASLRRLAVPALAALILILAASAFFIDYRALFTKARDRIAPLEKEELLITQDIARKFVTFELDRIDRKKNALVFTLAHGPEWPVVETSSPSDALGMDWPEFNSILAIRHGRCRITLSNKNGEPLLSREIDIKDLLEQDSLEITLTPGTARRRRPHRHRNPPPLNPPVFTFTHSPPHSPPNHLKPPRHHQSSRRESAPPPARATTLPKHPHTRP